ncbi:uncharacterized protein MONOS_6052 [Monocercomonoides exilis]|uniref:uncharacterized protein n=1 Tax=Monocercomonoides exilis TaxID=2049356 RepID=UPI00355A74E9|nr:hypothetical protein MONOS_6052 [Monocercomonoides exilis]|eukprot:MONOS_6052.1-p1 / transcript=MONOS_6052.1 / gene=MONOS_6052 / organism=Monocercomonoides_exilis_PA203 / gene_product=unspecified product / transcript_product=unspecified product / location=Mono_scaffold00185:82348-83843(-) / protein_length=216 / sequence_SO=supercontig / SO=protein_coding / is_pseudo=false
MFFIILTLTLAISQAVNAEVQYEVYVKQSGDDNKNGTGVSKERKSLKSSYDLLRDDKTCKIYVVNDVDALTAEVVTFNKSKGITVEGINSNGHGNAMVSVHSEYSAAICLRFQNIISGDQLKWPKDGRNLLFFNCTSEMGGCQRNAEIDLRLDNSAFIEPIALAMKKSFAANYTRERNLWCVTTYRENDILVDVVGKYIDPIVPLRENVTTIIYY